MSRRSPALPALPPRTAQPPQTHTEALLPVRRQERLPTQHSARQKDLATSQHWAKVNKGGPSFTIAAVLHFDRTRMEKMETSALWSAIQVSINHISPLFKNTCMMIKLLLVIIIMIAIINNVHEWHLCGISESKHTLSCVIVTN